MSRTPGLDVERFDIEQPLVHRSCPVGSDCRGHLLQLTHQRRESGMRVQDDGGVPGDTRNEAEADPSGERPASTVRYVPVMTSEQLAAYQTALRSTQRGAADRDS
jgi:hypothetical protein